MIWDLGLQTTVIQNILFEVSVLNICLSKMSCKGHRSSFQWKRQGEIETLGEGWKSRAAAGCLRHCWKSETKITQTNILRSLNKLKYQHYCCYFQKDLAPLQNELT